jgi:transposase InsO family protein
VRTTLPDAQAREGLADLVDRDFRPPAADQLWVGDITYSAQLPVMCSPAA